MGGKSTRGAEVDKEDPSSFILAIIYICFFECRQPKFRMGVSTGITLYHPSDAVPDMYVMAAALGEYQIMATLLGEHLTAATLGECLAAAMYG